MDIPQYLNTLFLLTLLLMLLSFIYVNPINRIIKDNYKWILLFIILHIILVVPFQNNHFYGLEYEDAYIYNAYARYLLYNPISSVDQFLTISCEMGSLYSCELYGTYSGHLIGFPTFVLLINKILGFNINNIVYINIIFSSLSVLFLFIITYILIGEKFYACIVALIYSMAPVINVFHSSSLSEPFSGAFICIFFSFYYLYIHAKTNRMHEKILLLSTVILSLLSAIIIKRENTLLMILPLISFVVMYLSYFQQKNKLFVKLLELFKKVLPIIIISIFIVIFYWFKINIQETVRAEVGDVSGFPFQLKFLFSNSINFFKALINIKWFSFIGVLLVFGVAFIYKIIKYNYNFIYPFAIVIMFLIVYGSHYRSYYYIVLGEIAPLDAIRYLVNIFPIISICTVIVIKFIYASIEKNLFKIRKLVFILSIIPFFLISVYFTFTLKDYFSTIEKNDRINYINSCINILPDDSVLITEYPLLFQIYGKDTMFIVDMKLFEGYLSNNDLNRLQNSSRVFLFRDIPSQELINISREKDSHIFFNNKEKKIISKEAYEFSEIIN